MRVVFYSYLVWASFWYAAGSFSTSENAIYIAFIPPLALFYIDKIAFLWFPILVLVVVLLGCLWIIKGRLLFSAKNILIANFLFVGVFVISGEVYLKYRVESLLPDPKPECMNRKSFLYALTHLERAGAHTVYVHDGFVYRWSYHENGFYKSTTALSAIQCVQE